MGEKDRDTTPPSIETDDAPPWPDEAYARAELRRGDQLVRPATGTLTRRGRPPANAPKRQVTLRLDADVIDFFRAGGDGWQSRINAALKKAAQS